MAKKKPTKKLPPKKTAKSDKNSKSGKTGKTAKRKKLTGKVKLKPKSKYLGKKRGRKPSVPNRYNSIKSAISANYLETINRKIKRYELKIIYEWVRNTYGNQSSRYILMNIDLIIDNFWQQYCNLYPVNINNHARFFEWYNFKTYLTDEKRYHYPTDIIQVDLNAIGQGVFEFFFEDYPSEVEKYYEVCKSEGIKRESPPPAIHLQEAYCDIARKGNLFKYKLLLDEDIPTTPRVLMGNLGTTPTTIPPVLAPDPSLGTLEIKPVQSLVPQSKDVPLTPQQVDVELEKERIKQEFLLREMKLKELAELLKQKIITFEEYMKAIKEI